VRKLHSAALIAAVFLAPSWALAHAGHQHSLQGMVTSVDARRLVVKSAEAQSVELAVGAKTVWLRGATVLPKCDAQPGERVVVEFEESGTAKNATRVMLPVKAAKAAALYVCPMHSEVVSDKPGQCPKCGMALVPKARQLP